MLSSVRENSSTLIVTVLICYGGMLLQSPILKLYHCVAYTNVVMNAQLGIHEVDLVEDGSHIHSQEQAAISLEELKQAQKETEQDQQKHAVQKQKKDFKISISYFTHRFEHDSPIGSNFDYCSWEDLFKRKPVFPPPQVLS